MNLSDVPLQICSREHLRTERAMFAHMIMNSPDVLLQIRGMEHLGAERAKFTHIIMKSFDVSCQLVEREIFSTARALFLYPRVDHLHVLGEHGRSYLLLALGAFSCVAHVSFPDMAFYARRAENLVTITAFLLGPMDAFNMRG